jgi:uncharacterized protein DUF3850
MKAGGSMPAGTYPAGGSSPAGTESEEFLDHSVYFLSSLPFASSQKCYRESFRITVTRKLEKSLFAQVTDGEKRDVPLADCEVQAGDTLILEEWDQETQECTGRNIETVVTAAHKVARHRPGPQRRSAGLLLRTASRSRPSTPFRESHRKGEKTSAHLT